MSDKPIFDSEQGRQFFNNLQAGVEQIRSIKERLSSKDAFVRKKALEELHEAVAGAKEKIEALKKIPGFKDVRALFEDPRNFTPEQMALQSGVIEDLKSVFSPKASKPKKPKSTHKKKRKGQDEQDKWVRS